MADGGGWTAKITQAVLTWFSQKEVKTPLSFFFRMVGALVVIVVVALFLSDPSVRYRIFLFGLGMLLVFAIIITLFTWLSPKNLVYGETGHRAETKLAFGTDKREMKEAEIAALPGTENPKNLGSGQ